MALFSLILFIGVGIFLFYYELVWKKVEREKGKNLAVMAKDFLFSNIAESNADAQHAASGDSAWDDWRYRMFVELHRREQMQPNEAAQAVGVSTAEAAQYLDQLEGEGKVRQVGDAERGIFYRVVRES